MASGPAWSPRLPWAAATGRDHAALRLPLLLGEYLAWRRRLDDLLAVTAVSVSAARRLGDGHSEGDALTGLGNALSEVRRFGEAITAFQDAAAIYRQTRDRHGEAVALANLGSTLLEVRRFDQAIIMFQDAAAIYRDTGDRHGEGMALASLGLALQEVRRFEEASTGFAGQFRPHLPPLERGQFSADVDSPEFSSKAGSDENI